MKVLILSCSTGGGHNSCAKYIEEELISNNIECQFMDFFDIVNNKAKELSSKIYLSTLGKDGEIFKRVYKIGETYSNTGIKSPVYLANKLHKKSLYKYIQENNFDLVIVSHLFPALTLTAVNNSYGYKKINFIAVATDYEPCPFFEEAKPDFFIIQKGLEERFINKGIKKETLVSTGIPISSRFVKTAKNIRDEYNIKNEKVILIMLGSMGFGRVDEVLNGLLEEKDVKVIVVCGSNKELYNNLLKINNDKLIVLGFVNNINDLIYSANIVLSKPGGISSTEVTVMRKPLIHIFPIPGIETYNTLFFKDRNMSLKCDTKEEIIINTRMLLNDTGLQEKMIKNQEKYINRESASDLVKLVLEKYIKKD